MELIQGTHKASKFPQEALDFISNMPDNVVTDILNRLPLQDAVRTGILSKNWRYKWTMLSHLIFDDTFWYYLLRRHRESKYGRIVSRLLLLLKGAITTFVLHIDWQDDAGLDSDDIANWVLFLSTKGVKDLAISSGNTDPLKVPSHLFSCLELTHLELDNFCFVPPASFHGFPNLLSLELHHVEFKSGKLGEFFTQCPALEVLIMGINYIEGQVRPVEISKLTNLKILSLYMCNLDRTVITCSSFISELVAFLPKLQELYLDFEDCKSFTETGARKPLDITFLCLKTLELSNIDIDNGIMLSFAFEMIRSFPNLQTLEIEAGKQVDDLPRAVCPSELNYNTTELLQLQNVVFTNLKASKNEVRLMKYLLACSPRLEKIVVHCVSFLKSKEKLMFSRELLKLQRASPVAIIDCQLF